VVSSNLNSIEFTPDDANAASGCGTIGFTFTDGEDTEAITLTIDEIKLIPYVTFDVKYGGTSITSKSGFCWGILTDGDMITNAPIISEESCAGSTNSSGVMTLSNEGLTRNSSVKVIFYYPEKYKFGAYQLKDVPFSINTRVR